MGSAQTDILLTLLFSIGQPRSYLQLPSLFSLLFLLCFYIFSSRSSAIVRCKKEEASFTQVLLKMLVVAYGLAFLTGLMLNGSTIFIVFLGRERAIDLVWSFNLATADFIFISLLPLRVWSMSTSFDILLMLNSSITALYMVSRAFFLAALTVCCTISVASPEWFEESRAFTWGSLATVVIWALSFAFSMRYHDLWEAVMLSKDLPIDLDEGMTMRPLSASFLVWCLCLFTLMMICYSIHTSKHKKSHHAWSTELLKRPFNFLLAFFLCWLPYHVLYFLLVIWLDTPAKSSPGFISGCQVALFLAYFGCCFNPIICLSTIQEFGSHLQQSESQQPPRHQHSEVQHLETLS